jgi:hypothetical protein
MPLFLQENALLVLGLTGAVISFLIFLTEKIARKKNARIVVILAAMGFLILTGQQVIEHLKEKNRNLLNEARTNIVKDIRLKVTKTLTLVEQLSGKLKGQSPEKIGVEIVQSEKPNNLLEFGKGPPGEWHDYAGWLEASRGDDMKVTCLTMTISANRHYDIGLLLAYLLTNSETKRYIRQEVIEGLRWESFPDREFIDRFKVPNPDVDYVLFYHGDQKNLIAYADARLFASELMLYAQTGGKAIIESVFNRKYPESIKDMKKYFKSFQAHVAEGKDAYAVAEEMLNKRINEMAVRYDGKLFLVNLANIVKIVS